jgi:hypothetical protein
MNTTATTRNKARNSSANFVNLNLDPFLFCGACTIQEAAIHIRIEVGAPAMFVTLTTLAQGHFSDNTWIVLLPGFTDVWFFPISAMGDQYTLLCESLRVQSLN